MMGWQLLKRWDRPIRFLLITSFLAISTLAAAMRISGQAGYPWPGFIHYRLPELAGLFLGFMWVVGLVTASVVERPQRWDNALYMLFFGLAAATIFRALTPDGGLPRMGVLILVGLFVTNTFMCDSRHRLLRQSIFLFFLLIMFKFVFVPWVAATGGLVNTIAKGAVALLTLGGPTRPPSGAEHVMLFTAMVLFAAAVALQWPSRSVWVHLDAGEWQALPDNSERRRQVAAALVQLARASGALEGPSSPLALPGSGPGPRRLLPGQDPGPHRLPPGQGSAGGDES